MACEPAGPPFELEEGVSESLAGHRAETLREPAYELRLRVPADDGPLTGTARLRFSLNDPSGAPVVVDFVRPEERVRAVRVDGEAVEWRASFDHVVVDAGVFGTGDHHSLEIDFTAGDEALNRNPDFLYTLFVPDRAHFSIPVFDQPDLKAPVKLTLEIPSGWRAVANGALLESEASEDGTTRLTFAETQPVPTYLIAFAVGDFRYVEGERDGRTFGMYHRETDTAKVERNAPAVFDLHASALEWLQEYTGIDYPYGKFDFVLIPPFQYGGMEHPGSIFYRESSLLLDEAATQGEVLGRASLIAHETAHMWFGNLVTMAWFDDVWTKEVFANFMAARIVNPSFPELDHDLRFFLAHHNTAWGIDRTPGANPIRQPLENLREAGTLYGGIIYQKAPVVMRQLELLVGEETFREGMREYLATFAHGNATWPDLIAILDERTEEDLATWSRVWVEESGRPLVRSEMESEGGEIASLALVQEDPDGEGRIWPQALEVALLRNGLVERIPVRMVDERTEIPEARGRPVPDALVPNGAGVEYGHFHLDERSRGWLLEHLPEVREDRLRGIAWVTLWDGVQEAEVDPVAWFDLLLRGIDEEPEEQNLQRVLGFLDTTYWRLLTPPERSARTALLEEELWGAMEAAESTSRKAALFGAWRGIVGTPEGVGRLRRLWAGEEAIDGVPLSESDRIAMAASLALHEVEGHVEILDRQLAAIENPDRRARFQYLRPALSNDPEVRRSFFESLSDPAMREREPWVLSALGYLHHPHRQEESRAFVIPSLEMVLEIQQTGDIFFPQRWLGASLGSYNDPELATEVRAWIRDLPDGYPDRLRGKILQSADGLFRAARIAFGLDP